MIKIPELHISVKDVEAFNDAASGILSDFTESLNGDYIEAYDLEDEDMPCLGENVTHFYTAKGMEAIEAEYNELVNIGCKYFYIQDIDIINDAITEP